MPLKIELHLLEKEIAIFPAICLKDSLSRAVDRKGERSCINMKYETVQTKIHNYYRYFLTYPVCFFKRNISEKVEWKQMAGCVSHF